MGPSAPASAMDVPPAAPAEIKPFELSPLLGPYEHAEDICKLPNDVRLGHWRCGTGVPASTELFEGKTALEGPSEPYLEVRLVARNDYDETEGEGAGLTRYHLGIRARDGWFFLADFAETSEPSMGSHHEWLAVEPMRLVPASAKAAPWLELVYWRKTSDDDLGFDENHSSATKEIVLCGFARDGRPRCTAPTPIAEEASETRLSTGAVASHSKWGLDLRYGPGQVELVVPSDAGKTTAPPVLPGRHPLDFDGTSSPVR